MTVRISFLLAGVHGVGGTIRTTVNLANGLARRHDVEIVSMAQSAAKPFFAVDPQVRLRSLTGSRTWKNRVAPDAETAEREQQPAVHVPATEAKRDTVFNAATERELGRYLDQVRADAVIATRPGLNSLLARLGRDDYLRIGQEHLNLAQQTQSIREHIRDVHTGLDGLTVLTDGDRQDYTDFLHAPDGWVQTMPNPLPDELCARSRLNNPIIAAAGRLIPVKQYPKLVRAFAAVADKHPDWQLRIYGDGPERERIRAAIAEEKLHGRVLRMGRSPRIGDEFAKASMVAVSSRHEGFGMTIAEAFAAGVPVVSFDCLHGPRELIEHGRTGLLTTDQDVDALGAGLLRMVEDGQERHRMGANAVGKAAEFHIDAITARWERYLAERSALRPRPRRGLRRARPMR